jgi:hypoxanthine-DNA glycosylase
MISESFAPIIDKTCKILILGTMPGIKSLEKQEYYVHERNTFWKIIFNLYNSTYSTDYQNRTRFILENGIALWDTLRYCFREGSLDSDIQSADPNDIPGLLKKFPKIKNVVFNGKYAEKFYKKYHLIQPGILYRTMPSTSPANARLCFEDKLQQWLALKDL